MEDHVSQQLGKNNSRLTYMERKAQHKRMANVSKEDLGAHEVRLFGTPLRSIGLKQTHHSARGVHLERISIQVLMANPQPVLVHVKTPLCPQSKGKPGKSPPAFGPGQKRVCTVVPTRRVLVLQFQWGWGRRLIE